MPSLIGSAPNQVPTNGMLGTMAFQDADNALVQNITVTGSSSVPTKAVTDNSTASASTAFVKNAIDTRSEILITSGNSSPYTVTPTIPITAYAVGQKFTISFHATNGSSSPSISVSGLASKLLKIMNSDGVYDTVGLANLFVVGQVVEIEYNGTDFIILTPIYNVSNAESATGINKTVPLTSAKLRSALNASGSAPIYACRAWVKFNGTGTPSISGSGNVSSIIDNGTGNYTLNFTSAMPDDTYTVVTSCGGNNATYSNLMLGLPQGGLYVTTAVQLVATVGGSTNLADAPLLCAAIFR